MYGTTEREEFIQYVTEQLVKHPDWFPAVIDSATYAIRTRLAREAEARTAAEAALVASLARKTKENRELLAQMIEKMQPTASFVYTKIVEELRS